MTDKFKPGDIVHCGATHLIFVKYDDSSDYYSEEAFIGIFLFGHIKWYDGIPAKTGQILGGWITSEFRKLYQ